MTLTIEQYAHDLKRNVSAVLAGTSILTRKPGQADTDKQNVLREMASQCEETLELLNQLFLEIETKTKRDGK